MADDQPTPADDPGATPEQPPAPPRPRGAGWDDDDDWVRRDLGPRPHVPDHGRRPVLVGIPILLITIAAVIAIVVAGCGGDDEPGPTASGEAPAAASAPPAGDAPTAEVEQALADRGPLLAGWQTDWDKAVFADAACEPTDGAGATDFRCTFSAGSGKEPAALRIRLQGDGTITKLLGSDPPVAGQKRSADAQALLAADDAANDLKTDSYVCATSTPVNPDGTSTGGTTAGQRCVRLKGKETVLGQRYVEFAPDGTALRDYALPDDVPTS